MKKGRLMIAWLVILLAVTCLTTTLLGMSVPKTINYQGYLTNEAGVPVNSAVNLTFSLYTVSSGGSPLWSETQNGIVPVNGLYAVQLGAVNPLNLAFDQQYWLGVRVGGDPELTPRQPLNSVPYARGIYLPYEGSVFSNMSSAFKVSNTGSDPAIEGVGGSGYGVRGSSASSVGVVGISTSNTGVWGQGSSYRGVDGLSVSGTGVYGRSTSGEGVIGSSSSKVGVRGISTSLYGVQGTSTSSAGVVGYSTNNTGVWGEGDTYRGVDGLSVSGTGVYGRSTSGEGVIGSSSSKAGVRGISTSLYGVHGTSSSNVGVVGTSGSDTGVWGISNSSTAGVGVDGLANSSGAIGVKGRSNSGTGVFGWTSTGKAGWFQGQVLIEGMLTVTRVSLTSDERFKKNIEPLSGSLEKASQLQGVSYEWRTEEYPEHRFDNRRTIGLIAQEVEKVVPEVVTTAPEDGTKSVEYQNLVPLLIEAVKELKARNEELSHRLEILEQSCR